jgi:signal transduction histidine kinase
MTMPRTLSFRARLTLRWTAAFGLLLAATLTAIYAGSRTYAHRDFDGQVRTVAATELASAVDGWEGVHLHDFPLEALGTTDFAGKFAQLYADDGRILAQSPSLADARFRLPAPVLSAALDGVAPLVPVSVGGRGGRLAALRASRDDRHYVVAVGLFTDRLDANLARLAWLLVTVWLAGVMLTGFLGYVLASRALEPIERITHRAAAVVRGDFETRLDPPATDDEIGRMTRLLNEMLDRLHGALEANRRFAADASHELRSPLTAMAGEIDVTLKRQRSAGEYRETLEVVRERLRELSSLTENLMLLARAQEHSRDGVLKEVPLTPLVAASIERLSASAGPRGIRFRLDGFPDLVVYGDPRLLARVLDNVLENAVQYNRDGGDVVLQGHVDEASPDAWEACSAVISVTDTGPGIPRDEWTRVFERFHRLDQSRSRRTGGAGLGLSICEAILSLFRGSIRIIDSSPHGTTFEIRLPGRCADAAPAPTPAAAHTQEGAASSVASR